MLKLVAGRFHLLLAQSISSFKPAIFIGALYCTTFEPIHCRSFGVEKKPNTLQFAYGLESSFLCLLCAVWVTYLV